MLLILDLYTSTALGGVGVEKKRLYFPTPPKTLDSISVAVKAWRFTSCFRLANSLKLGNNVLNNLFRRETKRTWSCFKLAASLTSLHLNGGTKNKP